MSSPVWNFHDPVSATVELPRVTTCAGVTGAPCADTAKDEKTDRRPSSTNEPITRMAARVAPALLDQR
jgi:hypothetical protein